MRVAMGCKNDNHEEERFIHFALERMGPDVCEYIYEVPAGQWLLKGSSTRLICGILNQLRKT